MLSAITPRPLGLLEGGSKPPRRIDKSLCHSSCESSSENHSIILSSLQNHEDSKNLKMLRLRILGINSGTSMDGIDLSLVEFTQEGKHLAEISLHRRGVMTVALALLPLKSLDSISANTVLKTLTHRYTCDR